MNTTDLMADEIEAAISEHEAENKRIEESLRRRFEAKKHRCIGEEFKVRLSKNSTVKGVIKDVEIARFHYTRRSVRAIFKVSLEAGVNKKIFTVHVDTLPFRG